MEGCKSFRVDWFPRDAFIDFSRLTAEEIGVLMQIINLIYSHNKAIDNDPKYIGRTCNIARSKCDRIIKSLAQKGDIYFDEEGKIHKKRCKESLKEIEERRKIYSENGKKGSAVRWKTELKQRNEDSQAISVALASTNINTNLEPNTHVDYNIENHLDDIDRHAFRKCCPGEDLYFYMREFNAEINRSGRTPPMIPAKAFLSWSEKYFCNHSTQSLRDHGAHRSCN